MDESDKGIIIEYAAYNGKPIKINGNYFVMAGDKEFMLAFYKTECVVISNGIIFDFLWQERTLKETFTFEGLPEFTIERLDKENIPFLVSQLTNEEYLFLEQEYGKRKAKEIFLRAIKRISRNNRIEIKNPTDYEARYKASWDYDGDHYEVIYGYGVDPNEKFNKDIISGMSDYSYTQNEINKLKEFWGFE